MMKSTAFRNVTILQHLLFLFEFWY